MSKVIIQCPGCGQENRFYLVDSIYEGPLRCWKCRGTFLVRIENEELMSCEPISETQFEEYST